MSSGVVRIGIVGVGGMGSMHADYLSKGSVPNGQLVALCDSNPERLNVLRTKYGDGIKYFDNADALLAAKVVDAIMIATPHYDHPVIALKGFAAGVHVLSEKPAGVYTKQVREMNAAAAKSGKVFAIMFNMRTIPAHQKVKDLIESGEIGEIRRSSFTITNWLRSQAYYDSGGWRGTWAGEGGGVLMNQAPHNLDLYQWFCGMPSSVRAYCSNGKYHHIEVEDDVQALLKYPNGATGVLTTTTGEAPGSCVLEIAGDRGRIVLDDYERITFYRNRISTPELIATTPKSFPHAEAWKCQVPDGTIPDQHRTITENWVGAIRGTTKLLAPGEEGIRGLTICNAIYMSSWLDKTIDLPLDEDHYYELLKEKIAKSTFKKTVKEKKAVDFAGSFGGNKA